MKPTSKTINGTSFHNSTITTTLSDLKRVLGKPHYRGGFEDKVQNEWEMETNDGEVFTVYDWKTYRPYNDNELIDWHIGGHNKETTQQAKQEILDVL
jgi:hypothetical protein